MDPLVEQPFETSKASDTGSTTLAIGSEGRWERAARTELLRRKQTDTMD